MVEAVVSWRFLEPFHSLRLNRKTPKVAYSLLPVCTYPTPSAAYIPRARFCNTDFFDGFRGAGRFQPPEFWTPILFSEPAALRAVGARTRAQEWTCLGYGVDFRRDR